LPPALAGGMKNRELFNGFSQKTYLAKANLIYNLLYLQLKLEAIEKHLTFYNSNGHHFFKI
jgi:hypothetical protein